MRRAWSCGGGGGVVAVVAVVAVGRLRRYGRRAASSSSRATHACRAIEAHSCVGVAPSYGGLSPFVRPSCFTTLTTVASVSVSVA